MFENNGSFPGETGYHEISSLPKDHNEERQKLFNRYSVPEQIEIYLLAEIHRAPSDTVFLEYLKENGAEKTLKIARRIKSIESLNAKAVLMKALWNIDRDCDCVGRDSAVMEILEDSKDKLGNPLDEGDQMAIRNYNFFLDDLKLKKEGKDLHPDDRRSIPNENGNVVSP
ncbi:MAG: hypothetical protein KIS76_01850 [Pyrinomonadaceae bacterium]|nr:hypothetical protein [Pyrinomonadaceae bacterium]